MPTARRITDRATMAALGRFDAALRAFVLQRYRESEPQLEPQFVRKLDYAMFDQAVGDVQLVLPGRTAQGGPAARACWSGNLPSPSGRGAGGEGGMDGQVAASAAAGSPDPNPLPKGDDRGTLTLTLSQRERGLTCRPCAPNSIRRLPGGCCCGRRPRPTWSRKWTAPCRCPAGAISGRSRSSTASTCWPPACAR